MRYCRHCNKTSNEPTDDHCPHCGAADAGWDGPIDQMAGPTPPAQATTTPPGPASAQQPDPARQLILDHAFLAVFPQSLGMHRRTWTVAAAPPGQVACTCQASAAVGVVMFAATWAPGAFRLPLCNDCLGMLSGAINALETHLDSIPEAPQG